MADISFEELVDAAQKLSVPQQAALIYSLQFPESISLTREQALAELEALRSAGAFNNVESLRGRYARSGVDVSAEELNVYLHKISTSWERDFDDGG